MNEIKKFSRLYNFVDVTGDKPTFKSFNLDVKDKQYADDRQYRMQYELEQDNENDN